jgi:hypothetical protein
MARALLLSCAQDSTVLQGQKAYTAVDQTGSLCQLRLRTICSPLACVTPPWCASRVP